MVADRTEIGGSFVPGAVMLPLEAVFVKSRFSVPPTQRTPSP